MNRSGVLIVFLCFFSMGLKAQSDTLFWFAVPHVQQVGNLSNYPFNFHFANPGSDTVQITLDVPANPMVLPQTLLLLPGSRSVLDVTHLAPDLVNSQVNSAVNKGVRIRASSRVQAYYEVGSSGCHCNQEFFGLKGSHAAGRMFYVAFQDRLDSDSSLNFMPYASIDFVALENGTSVTIESPVDLFGIAAASPVTVQLNAGQTYSIRSIDWRRGNKPNGVKLSASKRIAVTIKDEQVRVGGCGDLTGDQILPAWSLKSVYPLIRSNMLGSDVVTVMAVHDQTRIEFAGSSLPTLVLDAGEYRSVLAGVAVQSIRANKPIYAVQYSGIGCNIGMAMMPGLSCEMDSVYEFVRVGNFPLIFNFIIEAGYQDSIRINGGPPAQLIPGVMFNPLPGTNGQFLWAIFELHHNIIGPGMPIRISAPVGFTLGVRHGNPNQGMRFAYFGDYAGDPYYELQADSVICDGDTVRLVAYYNHNATPVWTFPDGTQYQQDTIIIPGFTLANEGWYRLNLLEDGCVNRSDSVYLELAPDQAEIVLLPPTRDSICVGDTLVLRSDMLAGMRRQWFNQMGAIPLATSDQLVVSGSGTYYAVAYTVCGDPDTSNAIQIFVEPNVLVDYRLSDTVICGTGSVLFRNLSGLGRGQLLMQLPDGSIIDFSGLDSFYLQQTGRYAVWYQTSVCSFDTSYFRLYPPETPPALQHGRLHICPGEQSRLWWSGRARAFLWYKDGIRLAATDSVLTVSETGFYNLVVLPDYPCQPDTLWLDTLYVHQGGVDVDIYASLNRGVTPLAVDFERLGSGGHQFRWFLDEELMHNDSIWSYIFERRGRYAIKLVVRDSLSGCADSAEVQVTAFDSAVVLMPTAFTPNGDLLNDFYLPYLYNAELVEIVIYNRWGELVYRSTQLEPGWDGRLHGEPAASGKYVCIIRYLPMYGELSIKSTSFILIR
jgi:gliding motility-associated-like protein